MPTEPAKLDETLDAKPYEPPKPKRQLEKSLLILALVLPALLIVGMGVLLVFGKATTGSISVPIASLVQELDLACNNFRLENGQYPWAKPDSVTATTEIRCKDVYIELRGLPGAKINTTQDYLGEVKKRHVKNGTLVDPWGHEIMIRVNPKDGSPVIWSCGKNGKDDTNTGTSPDPVKFPKTYYWFGSGSTGDDITNL